MANEKCFLKWHNYSDHLKQMLQELKNDDTSQDVTLVCDDNIKMKAHKIVLKACSPMFSSILDENIQPNPVIYLRGIHHEELQSILQFMYLGETSIYQGSIREFLKVAKDLQVKELFEDVNLKETETADYENHLSNHVSNHKIQPSDEDSFEKKMNKSISPIEDLSPQTTNKRTHKCHECDKELTTLTGIQAHIKSVHQAIRYPCNQCNFEGMSNGILRTHIQSKHEGITYPCGQCDYKATRRDSLQTHIKGMHEGFRYHCSLCDYSAKAKCNLYIHVKSKHEGTQYPCDQCDFKGKTPARLVTHKKSKHFSNENL